METLNDLAAALLQLTLGQKLPADLRLQGEPGGLTRALHPILIVTVKLSKSWFRTTSSTVCSQTDLPGVPGPESPQGSGSVLGQKRESARLRSHRTLP